MVDAIKTLAEIMVDLPDNTTQLVSVADVRQAILSSFSGFGAYQDLATKTVPLVGTADVALDVECDGAGSETELGALPWLMTTTWNVTTDRVDFAEMRALENGSVRLDFVFTPAQVNSSLSVIANFYNSSDVFLFSQEALANEFKTTDPKNVTVIIDYYVGAGIVNGSMGIQILSNKNSVVEIGGVLSRVIR